MTLEEAERIYGSPRGYSKEELTECIDVLNSQEVVLNELQWSAILDAEARLRGRELGNDRHNGRI